MNSIQIFFLDLLKDQNKIQNKIVKSLRFYVLRKLEGDM